MDFEEALSEEQTQGKKLKSEWLNAKLHKYGPCRLDLPFKLVDDGAGQRGPAPGTAAGPPGGEPGLRSTPPGHTTARCAPEAASEARADF